MGKVMSIEINVAVNFYVGHLKWLGRGQEGGGKGGEGT
jgi:hypothetical protein